MPKTTGESLLIVTIGVVRSNYSKVLLNLSFIKYLSIDIEIREGMNLFFSGQVWKVTTVIYNLDMGSWIVIVDKKLELNKPSLKTLLMNLSTDNFQLLKDCLTDLDIISSSLKEDYKFDIYSY